MITRLDDAASIVGEELANSVEKALREEVTTKSENSELVFKSELVEKITKNLIDDVNSEVEKAEFTKQIKSLSKEDLENFILDKVNKTNPEVEKCGVELENYKPFGGAKSMKDIEKYQEAQNLEYSARHIYYKFESAMGNILSDDDSESNDKITEMSNLIKEFQTAMKPENLLAMKSEIENKPENKSEVENQPNSTDVSVNSLTERIAKLEQIITNTQPASESVDNSEPVAKSLGKYVETELNNIISKSASEREVLMQNLLNQFGQSLGELHNKLGGVEKSETNVNDLIQKSLDEKINPLNLQISQLMAAVNTLTNKFGQLNEVKAQTREVPVSKSIVMPVAPPQTPNKPMSIRDIAMRSTLQR